MYKIIMKSYFKPAYERITLNKVTTAFFVFSFLHCFAQGIIQSFLYSIDSQFESLITDLTLNAGIPHENITFLEGSSGHLRLQICNDIPHGQVPYPCMDVFTSVARNSSEFKANFKREDDDAKNTGDTTIITSTTGRKSIALSQQCAQTLIFPKQILTDFRHEDATFVLLQFWLFIISMFAIGNDSVPHTLAVLITRGLITGWSIYGLWRTKHVEDIFREMISEPKTPCSVDFFANYFPTRIEYEIFDLILNCSASLIACYLSWTLLKAYNTQTFRRVGAPEHIIRINVFFMALLACLQLETFVLVAAAGLWIDVLFNTAIKEISAHTPIYKTLFICTIILLLPWVAMGWHAIRRERKKMMLCFLFVAFVIIASWSIMFYSLVYRWTFIQWPYFACFTVASFILLMASVVLGLICRVNFGQGLAQYLYADEALASSNFAPELFVHKVRKDILRTDCKDEES